MAIRDAQMLSTKMLVALLKAHGVRRVIISPGTTNLPFVSLVQADDYFELYSSADERSAAYLACGMSAEGGDPVAITCTGATASRNYVPALTEAYYRKLPVLAITGSQPLGRIGHGFPQMLDRTNPMNDIVKMQINVNPIYSEEDFWSTETAINDAILELTHRVKGPVHINLVAEYDGLADGYQLPSVRVINRYYPSDALPSLRGEGRTAIYVGSHAPFGRELTELIDRFCEQYNAVVLCDQTSNFRGRYRVLANLLSDQDKLKSRLLDIDTMIHIGEISGSYMNVRPKNVWRVSRDGKIMDTFQTLTKVFEMQEEHFFECYVAQSRSLQQHDQYLKEFQKELSDLRHLIPELPFSNLWCAKQATVAMPEDSVLHLGILNSLRSWNYFETKQSIECWANTGGFGIDGSVSTLIGASLADPGRLFFGVVGDLALFYDINSLGNRHVQPNVRLMVINNGRGTEFLNYSHPAARYGDKADCYIAAGGHYGSQSRDLLKHFASDLGFLYLSADSKESFSAQQDVFFTEEQLTQPIIFEIFTEPALESEALWKVRNLVASASGTAKSAIKSVLGEDGVRMVKRIMRK